MRQPAQSVAGAPPRDLYVGLSGLRIQETLELGGGIQLRPTFAHLFATDILAFTPPATPFSPHTPPWQAGTNHRGTDICAELLIPKEYSHKQLSNSDVAHTIVLLLRLWSDPGIAMRVVTEVPIAHLKERAGKDKGGELVGFLTVRGERQINLALVDGTRVIDSIEWVASHWADAADLKASSPEFELALTTLDSAQYIPNTAMMLVAVWGALEAIFAPHRAELAFRVSANLSAFLVPRGPARLKKQREITELYGLRSAAAHGSPKHVADDVVRTFELLRAAIIRMVVRKGVPKREELEHLLFVE